MSAPVRTDCGCGGAKYTGKPGAMGAGNMVLIGFSLASGSSAPVRTKHGGSTAPG